LYEESSSDEHLPGDTSNIALFFMFLGFLDYSNWGKTELYPLMEYWLLMLDELLCEWN